MEAAVQGRVTVSKPEVTAEAESRDDSDTAFLHAPAHRAGTLVDSAERAADGEFGPKRAALKILQCNNELCQYELRQDG